MKFVGRYTYSQRPLTAGEVVEAEVGRIDRDGVLETTRVQVERLAEIVGVMLELMSSEQQIAVLARFYYDLEETP